jgi:uncharacterized protein YdeI (YjbR/CyaY-like superfamily)
MNPLINPYFTAGCGRCSLFNTPKCKVNKWQQELALLRMTLLDFELTEELKWSVPCYTWQGNNIVLLSAFNEYCALSFFKGSLLSDSKGILIQQTENVQATRQIRFANVAEIAAQEATVKAYIQEAIEIEKAGLKVRFKTSAEPICAELHQKLEAMPAFKTAFYTLTPGRQRGYNLYFSAPKQAKTRTSRVEKSIAQILAGKGIHD